MQTNPLQPIEASKLYLAAAAQIADAVSSGRWKPGEQLPSERELAETLNISRSTIRQALAALEAIDVIRRRAGLGTFVHERALEVISQEIISELVTEGDPMMLVEARRLFEPNMVKLAAEARDEDDLLRLRSLLDEMETFGQGDMTPEEYVDADIEFHLLIGKATHNLVVAHLCEEMANWMHRRVWRMTALPGVAKHAMVYKKDHAEILDAICSQQGARAKRLMVRHLRTITGNLRTIPAAQNE